MEDEYERDLPQEYKPSLSVLFNAFIMAQIANAFVSRRIGLECDFFKNIATSHIFIGIMVTITALQAIIMQTPISSVFKVQPLDWKEWLACITIGIGAIPFSWAVRLTVRGLQAAGASTVNTHLLSRSVVWQHSHLAIPHCCWFTVNPAATLGLPTACKSTQRAA